MPQLPIKYVLLNCHAKSCVKYNCFFTYYLRFTYPASFSPPSNQALEGYTKKLKVVRGLIISDEMPSVEEKSAALDRVSHGEASVGEDTTLKILRQRFKAACDRKMKEQLLEKEKDGQVVEGFTIYY